MSRRRNTRPKDKDDYRKRRTESKESTDNRSWLGRATDLGRILNADVAESSNEGVKGGRYSDSTRRRDSDDSPSKSDHEDDDRGRYERSYSTVRPPGSQRPNYSSRKYEDPNKYRWGWDKDKEERPQRSPSSDRDQPRDEAFYRLHFRLGTGCRQNECLEWNRTYDPFCLCHLDTLTTPMVKASIQGDRQRDATPAGLQNLGNTCYMNSYLQTLFHIVSIRKTLYDWRKPPLDRRLPGKQYELVESLRELFVRLQSTPDRSVSPSDLVTTARVNVMLQQDVQEFSVMFLDWIDQVLAEKKGEEKVRGLFKGRSRSTITCLTCHTESSGDSDIYDFALQTNEIQSVEASLKLFFADEQVDAYACNRCGGPQPAAKKIQLVELPRLLNLHLLRFAFDRTTGRQRKLSHAVGFPKILDLRPFLNETQVREWGEDGCRYELKAVLIHLGDVHYGHYYARIRADGGQWYTFNDEAVVPYNSNELETDYRGAYMLVYERRSEIERQARIPDLPREKVAESGWSQLQLRKALGGAGLQRFLFNLKAKPKSPITWLPRDWLIEVVKAMGQDVYEPTIKSPDIGKFLCYHGRIGDVGGMKAVDSSQARELFDILRVAPRPYLVDGNFLCMACSPISKTKDNYDWMRRGG